MKRFNIFRDLDRLATQTTISEVMVKKILTLRATDNVQQAVTMMSKHSIAGIIVCNKEDQPIGIISEGDLLKKVFHKGKDPRKVKIKDVMTKGLKTINPDTSIGEASVIMKKMNISKLPVAVNGRIIGMVTKSDLLEKLNEIYYQNTRLKWFPVMMMIMLIIIAVLLVLLIENVVS